MNPVVRPIRTSPKALVTLLPVGLLALVLAGCASSSLPPERLASARCEIDERLAGTWRSHRTSQVGPSWMRFTFGCDCTYRSRVQLLWTRITERGTYRVQDGAIVAERPSGDTTRMPFELEGQHLRIEEAPGEVHVYERSRRLDCGEGAAGAPGLGDQAGGPDPVELPATE